jgi:hypothetical protein
VAKRAKKVSFKSPPLFRPIQEVCATSRLHRNVSKVSLSHVPGVEVG